MCTLNIIPYRFMMSIYILFGTYFESVFHILHKSSLQIISYMYLVLVYNILHMWSMLWRSGPSDDRTGPQNWRPGPRVFNYSGTRPRVISEYFLIKVWTLSPYIVIPFWNPWDHGSTIRLFSRFLTPQD